MGQRIGLDLDRVIRVGSRQADLTSAFRPYDTSIQCPRSRRWIELGACLGTADWILALAGLQIRSVKTRIAFPEERCLNSVVAGNEGLLVFPGVAGQPDRQSQKASTPLACASRPTTEQLQVQP